MLAPRNFIGPAQRNSDAISTLMALHSVPCLGMAWDGAIILSLVAARATRCPQADAVEKRGNAAAAAQMDWHVIADSNPAEPVPVCSICCWQGRRASCSGHGERETVGNAL